LAGGRQGFYTALCDELIAFAERRFALNIVGKDGVTHFDRVKALLKRTRNPEKRAKLEAEIKLPSFPQPLAYLWTAYHRIRRRKGVGFAGPEPIGWSDIEAFNRMTRMRLAPWEVEVIETLDNLYLDAKETDLDDDG